MSDPRILLNWQIPFDDAKVQLLDSVVNAMYGTNQQDVSTLSKPVQILCPFWHNFPNGEHMLNEL